MAWSLTCHVRYSEGIVTPTGRQIYKLMDNYMKKSKIALVVLSTIMIASCGVKTEEKQVPSKPTITETVIASTTDIEVCVKDAQGKPIMTASGICWNPGEVVILSSPKEVEKPLEYKSVEPSKEVEAVLADLEKKHSKPVTKPVTKPIAKPITTPITKTIKL